MKAPETLRDAILYFSDFEHCPGFMISLRWPDGVVRCPQCGSDRLLYIPKEKVWKCYEKHERAKFSLKTGTIFEDSPIALEKWLPVMWQVVNCKNGISSYEIHRAIGVTQKTAWFMSHRCRLAMQDVTGGKLGGEVEVDETFIGGKARNMHKNKRAAKITGTGGADKEIAIGMVERGGKVRVFHVSTRRKQELQSAIREHVEAGAATFSDELKSYGGLENEYRHAVIDHAVEYVNGNVHTNTMENFWSLLKRGLHGTYISVEPFHLFRYLDEQAFRYNNRRDADDADCFMQALRQIVDRRVTYRQLTDMVQTPVADRQAETKAGPWQEIDAAPLSAEKFENTPEFRRFNDVMRTVLMISKSQLDKRVKMAKRQSPRTGNPNAPGRKPQNRLDQSHG